MKSYTKAYEQYCSVLKRNIVLEETVFCNGTRTLQCTRFGECSRGGGCTNALIQPRLNTAVSRTDTDTDASAGEMHRGY